MTVEQLQLMPDGNAFVARKQAAEDLRQKMCGLQTKKPETWMWFMIEGGNFLQRVALAIANERGQEAQVKVIESRATGDYFEEVWKNMPPEELDAHIYKRNVDDDFISFGVEVGDKAVNALLLEAEFMNRLGQGEE